MVLKGTGPRLFVMTRIRGLWSSLAPYTLTHVESGELWRFAGRGPGGPRAHIGQMQVQNHREVVYLDADLSSHHMSTLTTRTSRFVLLLLLKMFLLNFREKERGREK